MVECKSRRKRQDDAIAELFDSLTTEQRRVAYCMFTIKVAGHVPPDVFRNAIEKIREAMAS